MSSQKLVARQLLLALVLCVPLAVVVPLLAWASLPAGSEATLAILSTDSEGILVQLEVPDFELEPAAPELHSGLAVEARGLSGWTSSPGLPRLPYHSALVAVPPGASVSLQVVSVESRNQHLSLPVENSPIPGAVLSVDGSPAIPLTQAHSFGVDGRYPQEMAVVSSPLYFRDQRLVRLTLYPFQVESNARELIFHRRIVVRLRFNGAESVPAEQIALPAAATDRLLEQSVLNYAQGRQWRGYPSDLEIPQASPTDETPLYRIEVDHDGMYRVSYQDLVAAGMDVTNTHPLSLSLSSQGDPIAIDWFGDDDELFEPDESFVFFGQRFRGTVSEEQYTDVNVYWLQIGVEPGLRMQAVSGVPSGAPAVWTYQATMHIERDAKFTHLHTTELGEIDTWYMKKTNGGTALTFPVTVTAIASGSFSGAVRLEQFSDCRYTGNPEFHQVQVRLNDVAVETQTWQSQGGTDNCSVHTLSGPVAQDVLREGPDNTLTWIVSTTHPYGEWLNWWELSYQRDLVASNDQLVFGLEHAGERVFTVTGFTTSTVSVWDISSTSTPTRILSPLISGNGPYSASFQLECTVPGMALAAALSSLETTANIYEYRPEALDPPGGADWIAITHHDFITEVRRLADYRQEHGLRAWVVDVDHVYNQYGDGIYQPAAIREYLIHSLGWPSPAPSYAVLVGDGNWNYKSVPDCYPYCDPDPIFVPPYMGVVDPYQGQVPVDNLFATLVYSDSIPDIALGRLPVRTVTETAQLVDRIMQHEAQLIEPDDWQYDFTFLADEYDPSAGDFHAQSDLVVNQLPAYLRANRIYHMEAPYTSPAATRDALVGAFNQGTTLVNYRGHGGVLVWGDDGFFSVGHLGLLTSTKRLPAVVSFDCLDTYFAIPSLPSLGETLMRNSPAGSIAHWGSSGLGISSDHLILNQALFSALFEGGFGRLGDAILSAKLEFARTGWQMHNLHTFTLLGDPAMPLMVTDLCVGKSVVGTSYRHVGNSLTYVITATNQGLLWSNGAVITDLLPAELTHLTFQWSGLQITPTAGVSFAWTVGRVDPYDHGVITVSGRVDPSLAGTAPFTIVNTAVATAAGLDWDASNNIATAVMPIVPGADVYLPLLVRGH